MQMTNDSALMVTGWVTIYYKGALIYGTLP
jgi:hypothetical protein